MSTPEKILAAVRSVVEPLRVEIGEGLEDRPSARIDVYMMPDQRGADFYDAIVEALEPTRLAGVVYKVRTIETTEQEAAEAMLTAEDEDDAPTSLEEIVSATSFLDTIVKDNTLSRVFEDALFPALTRKPED